MPLNTNLNSSPYFDDFDRNDNYYRILFKPATAVQVREINQLQTILQDQIEQFGDHILKAGTILEGCQFQYLPAMAYVKISDNSVDGKAIDLDAINGLSANGQTSGKIGTITHIEDGFEQDGINLKTIYIEYDDDDSNANDREDFQQGEEIRIFARDDRLYNITVDQNAGGALAFSNNDAVVITSAIEIANLTDGSGNFEYDFLEGETITDSTGTIDMEILESADANNLTEDSTLIVRIKPRASNQFGNSIDVDSWDLKIGTEYIHNSTSNTQSFKIVGFIGEGATGSITTSSTGQLISADITRGGSGYSVLPHVSLYSQGATQSQLTGLTFSPENWLIKLQSAQVDDTTGYGYGVKVGKGKIYQKGLFLNADEQFKMVDKYSNTPSDVSIGFDSTESIVNVFSDSSLYDNASGFLNESAPGADRLSVSPVLVVRTTTEEKAAANYFPLVRFSEGKPFQQNKLTQYNKIGDMIAQRTYEESGNYVLDPFEATTRTTSDFAESNSMFSYVIDPGHAYVNGYRVKTETNFVTDAEKGTATQTETGQNADVIYANVIELIELAGVHKFNVDQEIELKDTAANFISTYDYDSSANAVSNTVSTGATIGTAKIRSLQHVAGTKGTPDGMYRMYLYDVQLNKGKNFRSVRSIYSPGQGGEDGIADLVLYRDNTQILRGLRNTALQSANGSYDPVQFEDIAVITAPDEDSLIFDMQKPAKTLANYNYVYNSSVEARDISATGIITVNREGTSLFPYFGQLSDVEESEITVIPNQDITASAAEYTGATFTTAAVAGTADKFTITSSVVTTDFTTHLREGEWITDGNGAVGQITSIGGRNKLTYRSNSGLWPVGVNASQDLYRIFPKDMPIDLSKRSDMYAETNGTRETLTIYLGVNVGAATSAISVFYAQQLYNTVVSLESKRKRYVKLSTADWPSTGKCVGLPGVYRLAAVYNGTDTSAEEVTNQFYLDSNQTGAYWGHGYLYKRTMGGNVSALAATILVEVDFLTDNGSHGLKTIDSYTLDDTLELDDLRLTSSIHTLEIPQVRTKTDVYYDLRECADFRPMVDATANTDATSPAGATLNPSEIIDFCQYTSFKFPKPQSDFLYDITYYIGRTDEISIKDDGTFRIDKDGIDLQRHDNPNKLTLYRAEIAPYPSLPAVLSTEMKDILNTGVVNNGDLDTRYNNYNIEITQIDPQIRVYTMNEISNLERRIRALEYNQNISELENSTINRTIQSSVDETIERFKFGFFVDNFENYALSNRDVDYYAASIYEYVLQPDRATLNIDFEIDKVSSRYREGDKVTFPFRRKTLLSQEIATYAPFVEVPEVTIIEACEFESNRNRKNVGDTAGSSYTKLQKVWEEFTFVGANESDGTQRNIEIKFYNPTKGIVYEVIQSHRPPTQNSQETGTVVLQPTTATAVDLDNSGEAIPLYQKLYPIKNARDSILPYSTNPWFESMTGPFPVSILVSGASKTYRSYVGAGKITIPYDHTKGRYITVRAHKALTAEVFNFEICYPAMSAEDSIYDAGADTVNTRPPPCPKGQYKYERCQGDDLVVYGCDGNYGTQVNRRVRNSPKCRTIVIDPPKPPTNTCPKAGTFYKNTCSGTTQRVYTFTGVRGSGPGGCRVTVSDTNINSPTCGYKPTPPPVCSTPVKPPKPTYQDDDGCVIGVDPSCNIESPPVKPPKPPVKPPKPPVSTPTIPPSNPPKPPVKPPKPPKPPKPIEPPAPAPKTTPTKPPPKPPAPKPPKKPKGGGGCVHVDSYLPMLTEGQNRAYQMVPGSALWLGTEDLQVVEGMVIDAKTMHEPCVRITTESGITLVCSTTAPIYTSEGKYYDAPEVGGKQVAVMKDGKTWFDNVKSVDDVGMLDVRPIDTGDNNFWAGEKDGEYIMHHNMAFRLDSAGGFSVNKK